MAAETCFRVSVIAASAATTVKACPLHGLLAKDKASLPVFVGSRRWSASLSALLRPSPVRFGRHGRRGSRRFVCQSKNTVDEVLEAVDGNWSDLVLNSDKPVLVEFWAPWCGPCRMMAPVIADLAKEYAGKLVCCQVNTDNSPAIASQFGIKSIPTVLLFKDGEKKDSIIGAVPKSTLVALVDKYL